MDVVVSRAGCHQRTCAHHGTRKCPLHSLKLSGTAQIFRHMCKVYQAPEQPRLAQAEALLKRAFAKGMWGDEGNEIRNDIGRFLAGKSVEPVCTDCASLNAGVALADACEDEWDVLEELRRFGRMLDIVGAPHGIDEKADAIEAAVAKVRELSEAQEGGES